jgi:uncharacterized membrane protein
MFDAGFIRAEVWHALSVHFPIALLTFGTLTRFISLIIKGDKGRYWQYTASALLYVGCLTAWISIYTGNLADGIVSRKICDPTILKDHEIAAQTMTYLFTSAGALDLLNVFRVFKPTLHLISSFLILLLMIVGSGYLIYGGHLGASLVYEQGAGVYNHSVDCDDYK